jgi:hypothetical protein
LLDGGFLLSFGNKFRRVVEKETLKKRLKKRLSKRDFERKILKV